MEKFKGKKLLHIGRGGMSKEIIEYAKSQGAYVIYANKNASEHSNYKDLIDKAVDVDWNDLDAIIAVAKAEAVDAVTSAGGEKDIEICRVINEAIGNQYWHTAEQWQAFMNEPNFKKLCEEHNVKAPKTFYYGKAEDLSAKAAAEICYPAIVKPVDNSGGRGITVVEDMGSLRRAVDKAAGKSSSKEILIEEYIEGLEFGLTYVIKDGVCRMVNCCDKYTYKFNGSTFGIPHLLIYPSASIELIFEKCDAHVREMISSQGLNNTSVFFQGVCRDGEFYFFESGLRLEGSKTYLINWEHNKQYFFNFLIDYLLKVESDYDLEKDTPYYDGRSTLMQGLYLKKGRIKCIKGYDEVNDLPYVYGTTIYRGCGESIPKSNITFEILLMGVRYCCESKEEAVSRIEEVYNTMSVRTRFNRELIFKHVIAVDEIKIRAEGCDENRSAAIGKK